MRWGAVVVALSATLLTACSTGAAQEITPVPTFSASDAAAAGTAAPRIGLPEDCATFLSPDDLGAIFARPLGSTAMRTIKGLAEPTAKRTERVGCRYSASGQGGGNTLLDMNLGRYVDAAAAARQWQLNTNAERSDGQSRDLTIGTARAVAIERRAETVLAVVYGVDTLTFVLPASARAPGPPVDRLVDLALRVLPADGVSQPSHPDPPVPPTTTDPAPMAAAG
jgi:hypothetical protein